jgi:hypothetical protein
MLTWYPKSYSLPGIVATNRYVYPNHHGDDHRPGELDKLADDFELAAGIALAGSVQAQSWPATVRDLLLVAHCLRDVARRLRERPR